MNNMDRYARTRKHTLQNSEPALDHVTSLSTLMSWQHTTHSSFLEYCLLTSQLLRRNHLLQCRPAVLN